MYIILPSRLKEYPKGKMKETILLLHPNLSSSSTNFGKTASELVVENAMSNGSLILRNNSKSRFPKIKYPTTQRTSHKIAKAKKKSRK